MNYCDIKFCDSANGDGVRVSLWVSGCDNKCLGCFNEIAWDYNYGKLFTDIEMNEILCGCAKSYIAGLTILGGEPMSPFNQPDVLRICDAYKQRYPEKTLWIYTGYILERDLLFGQRKWVEGVTDRILHQVDVLVDGPFIQAQRDLSLRFRGSSNQRLLDKATIQSMMK